MKNVCVPLQHVGLLTRARTSTTQEVELTKKLEDAKKRREDMVADLVSEFEKKRVDFDNDVKLRCAGAVVSKDTEKNAITTDNFCSYNVFCSTTAESWMSELH